MMKTKEVIPKFELPPFPTGWYALGFSEELKPGDLITRRFGAEDVILYRTESGIANAVGPYCPHMGAHFGHGGKVVGEDIKCPFHGFTFGKDGACTSTAYGTSPNPKGKCKTYPFLERNGMLLIFHHTEGEAPDWDMPELDFEGFTPFKTTKWVLDSHPQETSENSVDFGHLMVVHGYEEVEMLEPLNTTGPYLNAKYAFSRDASVFGNADLLRAEIEIHVHGLGYSYVDVKIPRYGMNTRQFVLSTPIEDGKIELRIAMCIKKVDQPGKINPFMGILPKSLVNNIVLSQGFKGFKHDVEQDFKIWQNKINVHPPALAKGDGPVGQYRLWAKQFYPKNFGKKALSSEKPVEAGNTITA